jgi:hypothetical protein
MLAQYVKVVIQRREELWLVQVVTDDVEGGSLANTPKLKGN